MFTQYLNTDLVLVSETPLDQLCTEFERTCYILSHEVGEDGNWEAIIESSVTGSGDAAVDIAALLRAIAALSPDARRQWKACDRREFDLGFDAGETWTYKHEVPVAQVKRIAAAGCSFVVTIYSAAKSD